MGRFQSYNANPVNNTVGDCTVRAISKVLDQEWEKTYIDLCLQGYIMCDMPSANRVWGAYLKSKGYKRQLIDDDRENYNVEMFCAEHPNGRYILAISGHVVAAINGYYYDTWNSGGEVPVYCWYKEV